MDTSEQPTSVTVDVTETADNDKGDAEVMAPVDTVVAVDKADVVGGTTVEEDATATTPAPTSEPDATTPASPVAWRCWGEETATGEPRPATQLPFDRPSGVAVQPSSQHRSPLEVEPRHRAVCSAKNG